MLRDVSEVCCMIQRPNLYNLLTGKVAEKSLKQFTDQINKTKKVLGSQK